MYSKHGQPGLKHIVDTEVCMLASFPDHVPASFPDHVPWSEIKCGSGLAGNQVLAPSLVPRPNPLTRRNSLVNQVEFLGLAHTLATV